VTKRAKCSHFALYFCRSSSKRATRVSCLDWRMAKWVEGERVMVSGADPEEASFLGVEVSRMVFEWDEGCEREGEA
jgi:hypothetical protein